MQKVVNLLEKHVQWIVLGLGAVYLLWMVWSYVLNSPVAVPVGGRDVEPGKVDQLVYDDKATVLEGRMKQGVNINIPPPQDPVQKFLTALEGGAKHDKLPPIVFTPPTGKLDAQLTGQPATGAQQPAFAGIEQMDQLPSAPAAVALEARRGRSTVAMPDPTGAVDPQFAALGPVRSTDKDWVTVRFTVHPKEIASAFEAVKVPQQFMKTQFLRAELLRQEMLPDGNWGPEVLIGPLKLSTLPPFPAAADRVAIAQYNEWSRANQPEILQPMFYAVTKGDWWKVPGEEELAQEQLPAEQAVPFDPQQYLDPKADLGKLTMEQRREVAKARQAAKAEQQRGQRPQRTPAGQQGGGEFGPGGGGQRGGGGGRGPGQAYDPNRPRGYAPPMQQGGGNIGPAGGEFGPGYGPSEFGQGNVPNQPLQPQPGNYAAMFPIPNGEFDPRSLEKDITGWVHDDSVEPGKTYRYKIRYRIKSPVFQTFNVMKDQKLADQFDLVAPDSDWTSPISIPALTSFFIAANFDADSARSVRFDVFKFQEGTLHAQAFSASPGDAIGRVEKGVDFATGYTVVDIRRDLRNNASYILISDPSGRLIQRTFRADQDDPELKKLRQQRDGQASAGGAGG